MPTVDAAYLLLDGTESLSGGFVGPAIHVGPDAGPFDPQALRIHIPPGTPTTGGNLVIEESHDGLTGWTEVATFAIDSIATHEERITWTKRYLRADVDLAGDPSGMTIGIMDWAGYRRKGEDLDKYIDKVLGYSPIAYWPLTEKQGQVAHCHVNSAQDGVFANDDDPIDVAIWGVGEGIGDGHTAPWFDGISNNGVHLATATLSSAFNGDEGTVMAWAKVNAITRWADGVRRQILRMYVDNENYFDFLKNAEINELEWRREASNANEEVELTITPTVDWFCIAMNWSVNADEQRYFFNGAYQTRDTGIAAFQPGGFNVSRTRLGNRDAYYDWWGRLAHCAIWDTALDAPTIADLAIVP